MVVAQSTAPAGREDKALAILRNFKLHFAGFSVAGHGAEGHLYHDILALRTGAQVGAAALAVLGKEVLAVLQVQQRPELRAAFENNVATAATIATIGATIRQALGPEEVVRTCPPLTRAAGDFNVIDEVIISHFESYEF